MGQKDEARRHNCAVLPYLDRLYVHKDYQRRGIASAICDALEASMPGKPITTHASITAKPFFLQRLPGGEGADSCAAGN